MPFQLPDSLRNFLKNFSFSGSGDYWRERYRSGGNSGRGSYGELARFKAQVLNDFVATNNIRSVAELGCGDGNQAGLFDFPRYLGLDITEEAVKLCRETHAARANFRFEVYDPAEFPAQVAGWASEMAMSLDVIYHLVEDDVYETYLRHLFALGTRYVVIYSSNRASRPLLKLRHVRHRRFTDDVARLFPAWQLERHVPNAFPAGRFGRSGSPADFYIFSPRD